MCQFVAQTSSSVDPSSSHLAIVPYQPTLHAVLITLWAAALDNPEQHMEGTEMEFSATVEAEEVVSESTVQVPQKTVSLPKIISISNSSIPVESSSCRRSSRFKPNADQYLIELEDNPRKKQRLWREAASGKASCLQLLDNPPRPDDAEIPAAIPTDILKNWGILFDVSQEKLNDEALHAEKINDVPNDTNA